MPIKASSRFKLVPIEQLPKYTPKNAQTQYWIDLLKAIPEGQALVTTEADLGVKVGTVVSKVIDYQKRGWIPKGYHVRQKKHGDTRDIYILHESPEEELMLVEEEEEEPKGRR